MIVDDPEFPSYNNPPGPRFAERKQVAPLFKMAKHLMKIPKQKVLQRRNRTTKKKFRIV